MSWMGAVDRALTSVQGMIRRAEESRTSEEGPDWSTFDKSQMVVAPSYEPTVADESDEFEPFPDVPPAAPPLKEPSIAGMRAIQQLKPDTSRKAQTMSEQSNQVQAPERQAMVLEVEKRYTKYGTTVASAVLSKVLMPDGMNLLLQRLDLAYTGRSKDDHDHVCEFIARFGPEEFCRRLGVRYDADSLRREQIHHSGETRKARLHKYHENAAKNGTDPGVKLSSTNIQPVDLDTGERKARAADVEKTPAIQPSNQPPDNRTPADFLFEALDNEDL